MANLAWFSWFSDRYNSTTICSDSCGRHLSLHHVSLFSRASLLCWMLGHSFAVSAFCSWGLKRMLKCLFIQLVFQSCHPKCNLSLVKYWKHSSQLQYVKHTTQYVYHIGCYCSWSPNFGNTPEFIVAGSCYRTPAQFWSLHAWSCKYPSCIIMHELAWSCYCKIWHDLMIIPSCIIMQDCTGSYYCITWFCQYPSFIIMQDYRILLLSYEYSSCKTLQDPATVKSGKSCMIM